MTDQAASNVRWHQSAVSRHDRNRASTGSGCTVWLTGYSGSGKSTIAHALEAQLVSSGRAAYTLDGDNVRFGLNADLGFSPEDRVENVRRVGEVARLMADAGVVAIAPLISPYTEGRVEVRRAHTEAGLPFYLVHVSTPLEACEARDTKGLYAKARRGEIKDFTGINAPYEAPINPDRTIDTTVVPLEDAVASVMALFD